MDKHYFHASHTNWEQSVFYVVKICPKADLLKTWRLVTGISMRNIFLSAATEVRLYEHRTEKEGGIYVTL